MTDESWAGPPAAPVALAAPAAGIDEPAAPASPDLGLYEGLAPVEDTAPEAPAAAPAVGASTTVTADELLPATPAHAIAPGSADGPGGGGPVNELATLLEKLGETTYLTTGGNPDHVFTDDLMQGVRRILTRNAMATIPSDKIEDVRRIIASVNTVSGGVWQLLRSIAAKADAQAATT